MKQFIKRFEVFGITERQKGSGRPRTATAPENEKALGEMICSQEDHPGTYVFPKHTAEGLKISQSSVRRLIKKGTKQSKRLKLPYMNDATRK